jgi:hypothetical protein
MTEAQQSALNATRRITLTLSLFGCIEEVPPPPGEGVEIDGETDGETDTLTTADAGEPADGGLFVDALTRDGSTSEPAADLGPEVADGGPVTDGGVACNLADPDWAACCEAQNWNPAAGCMAWGPPVPPALA